MERPFRWPAWHLLPTWHGPIDPWHPFGEAGTDHALCVSSHHSNVVTAIDMTLSKYCDNGGTDCGGRPVAHSSWGDGMTATAIPDAALV